MIAAYTNGLQLKGCLLNSCGPAEYYKYYRYADICLAPLANTLFNAMKSNLKILEAANMGLPVIASHVQPYTGMDGVCYVYKQSDWHKWICALEDENERVSRGACLKQYCNKHYNYSSINQKRKECFNLTT
jgi:hypothetical protein